MGGEQGGPDRYVPLRKLGEGGAGVVWLVEDRLRPGALFALKELPESSRGKESSLRREFGTLSGLRHPNLAEVHELDVSPVTGLPRFTLEYVEGEDLVAAVAGEGPALLLDVASEALRALAFLHDFGFVHRDLKPGNLLVRRRPRLGCRLVVLDFGLAVQSHEGEFSEGGAAGTLPYLAPELLRGAPPSRRADLYSLGAVLFEAVFGRTPFPLDEGNLGAFVEIVRQGLASTPSLPEGYPAGLGAWLLEMLAPDPSLRPAQASEALARLNAACGTSFPAEVPASRAARLASGPPPGRETEIAKLWEALEPSEGPRVVWLCGGGGTGKTRLLRWLAGEAVLRGWDVVAPRPDLVLDDDSRKAKDPAGATLEKLRHRTESGTTTLVLLDEIESSGARVARFLDRVAREGKAAPLRVMAALRPGESTDPVVRKLLEDTGIVPTLKRIDLEPLDEAGIRALAERATGSTAISEARVKWLLATSDGNPLLAEALVVEGVWEKGGRGRIPIPRPETSIGRIELLSDAAKAWLEALSVLGEAREDPLAKLSGLEAGAAREAAGEVAAIGVARERDGRWRPESRITVDQVLAGIEPERRRQLHRRAVAMVIESEGSGADPWRLAHLWNVAGEKERAIESAMRAAQHSTRIGEPAEAAQRLAFALKNLARRDERRRALRMKQAGALEEAGLNPQAVRAYGAAAALSKDRASRAEALARQAFLLARSGKYARAMAVAGNAAKLARATGRKEDEARAKQAMGAALLRLNRGEEALPLLREAIAVFEGSSDRTAYGEALHTLGSCKSTLRSPDSDADYQKVIALFQSAGEPAKALKSLIGLGINHSRTGKFDEAREVLLEAQSLAQSAGNLHLALLALSWLAVIAMEQGRFDLAISLCREAEDQALHLGQFDESLRSRAHMGEALISVGRPAEAASILQTCLEDPRTEIVVPDGAYSFRLILAHALLEIPGSDETAIRTLIEKSLDSLRKGRRRRALLYALVQEMERRARPQSSDPFEPIKVEFDALAQGAGLSLEPEVRNRAGLAHATFLLARGNAEGARVAATDLIEYADGTPYLAYRAQARSILAESLEKLGRPEEADQVLKRGAEILKEAAERITDPAMRSGFLDRLVFRRLTESTPKVHLAGDRKLASLYEMIRILNSETDPDALLENILDMALRELRAERGMILLRDPGRETFSICVARNLERETEKDAEEFSRSIVAQAGSGRSVLTLDASHDERFRDLKSVSLFGIRCLMCVPLRSKGMIIGTVYLDTRKEGALFTQEDLRFLEAFADHAALALENAQRRASLETENRRLQAAVDARVQLGNLVGRSPGMQHAFDMIEKVAASDLSVLITGESGTGKELAARAIHALSPLRRKIFLSENCAAIPETLLESELFGVARGAYTGADRDRQGLFELADGGTLFLDEVGDMTPGMQARLLRVLQEGEIRRVGGEKIIKVHVRFIAATNRDLHKEVEAGRFRNDLLYRLQVFIIQLPALRERPGDVALLANHLLEKISVQRGRSAPRIEKDVMDIFERYPWPGNVRELENSLQRLALLAGDGAITRSLIESDPDLKRSLIAPSQAEPFFSLERSEREQIERALSAAAGNRDRAARLLGISRATIYRKIKEYRL